jgi:hypothetical protein
MAMMCARSNFANINEFTVSAARSNKQLERTVIRRCALDSSARRRSTAALGLNSAKQSP